MIQGADPTRLIGCYAASRWKLIEGNNVLYLPATGWLVMVLVQSNAHWPNALKSSISFDLRDSGELFSYSSAMKSDYRNSCGYFDEFIALRLAEPLINVNSAFPYKLIADSSHPTELAVMVMSYRAIR